MNGKSRFYPIIVLMEYAPEIELFDQVVRESEKETLMSDELVDSEFKTPIYLLAATSYHTYEPKRSVCY